MIESKFFKFLKIDSLLDSVKGYIDTKIQLFKLKMQEKAANIIASVIFIILAIFCCLMTLAFLSIALGNFLNEQFGNTYLGFCVLGLFYLIMLIILAMNISKGVLHRKVKSTIKKSFTKPEKKE